MVLIPRRKQGNLERRETNKVGNTCSRTAGIKTVPYTSQELVCETCDGERVYMYVARRSCRHRMLEAEKLEKERIKIMHERNERHTACSSCPCCQLSGNQKHDGNEDDGSDGGDIL